MEGPIISYAHGKIGYPRPWGWGKKSRPACVAYRPCTCLQEMMSVSPSITSLSSSRPPRTGITKPRIYSVLVGAFVERLVSCLVFTSLARKAGSIQPGTPGSRHSFVPSASRSGSAPVLGGRCRPVSLRSRHSEEVIKKWHGQLEKRWKGVFKRWLGNETGRTRLRARQDTGSSSRGLLGLGREQPIISTAYEALVWLGWYKCAGSDRLEVPFVPVDRSDAHPNFWI